MKDITLILAAILATALVLGCMGGENQTTTAGTSAPVAIAGETKVLAVESPQGLVLTDSNGMTLYAFLKDDSSVSNCNGQCASAWPPLTAKGSLVAGDGVRGKLDVMDRADGTKQVTYAHLPLYHYAGDREPGDIKGQGIDGLWYAVSPEMGPLMPAPPKAEKSHENGFC